MRTRQLGPEETASSLDFSIDMLARDQPELSARKLVDPKWRLPAALGALVVAALLALDAKATLVALISLLVAAYVAVTANRILLFFHARRADACRNVDDDEARAFPDSLLPVYTVLVPAFREPEVIGSLLGHLDRIEYPRDKLDVKLLLEEDDAATIAAALAADPADHVELILVPPAGPRTKPKALNFAMAFVEGSILTIYDAEDEPDPLQLRKAAIILGRSGPEVACLQAKLSFGNSAQNMITRWFTLEYAMWFELFLPGLAALDAPIPLGGTSNHFRVEVLRRLGAWDPNNVTEDADLGFRLARRGYRCQVLDSTTLEEANSDFVNWVKQRSRWYKGYLQTGLVHLRRPRTSWSDLRWKGIAELVLFVLGTPVLALLNTVSWALTLTWFAFQPHFIKELFPAPLFYPAALSWILGNFVVVYLHVLTCKLLRRFDLAVAAMLVPLYWVMMAVAAGKAAYQLVVTPSFWEKTTHGLTHHRPGEPKGGPSGALDGDVATNTPRVQ